MKKLNMLLIIVISLFCVSLFFGLGQAGSETIKMGFFEIKPHMFIQDGAVVPQGASNRVVPNKNIF